MIKQTPFGVMALVLLAACQHDRSVDNEFVKHDERKVSIVASIGKQTLNRTVADNNVFRFCGEDEMGVFAGEGSAYKWTLVETEERTEWQTETGTSMQWPVEDVAASVNFWGYSPYTGPVTDLAVTMPELSDQTGRLDAISPFDFLVAKSATTYKAAGGQVRFVGTDAFKHASSLVVLQIAGEPTMLNATIQQVLFKGSGIATPTKFVFEGEGRVDALPGAEVNNELTLQINQSVTADGLKICAVVNPLETELTFSLVYQRDGMTFETQTVTLGTGFLANNMYSYALKVNKGNVVITGAEITPWILNERGEIIVEEVNTGTN